jgi:hypothetical protein
MNGAGFDPAEHLMHFKTVIIIPEPKRNNYEDH